MGTSGFDDSLSHVCVGCSSVYFQGYLDKDPLPKCDCGERYERGCPSCGHPSGDTIGYESPYQYFATRTCKRGPGA
jgi:hypothetical protein